MVDYTLFEVTKASMIILLSAIWGMGAGLLSAHNTHHIVAVTGRRTDRQATNALVLVLAHTINSYVTEQCDWLSAQVMLGTRSRRRSRVEGGAG